MELVLVMPVYYYVSTDGIENSLQNGISIIPEGFFQSFQVMLWLLLPVKLLIVPYVVIHLKLMK